MPTEKRARQRAGREARLAAQAKIDRRNKLIRRGVIVVIIAVVLVGVSYLLFGRNTNKNSSATTTSTTTSSTTSTTAPATTTSTAATSTTAAGSVAAQQAAANAKAVAAGCSPNLSTPANTMKWSSPPAMTIDPSKTYTATVDTTAGTFTIALDAKQAPKTVNNFVFLAKQGFYKCVLFHRVIPNFMDQTGDPTGTGSGGPGYQFADENLPSSYAPFDVAMANSGPNTNGSQFFIIVPGGQSQLQSLYSLFGHVTSGQSVVQTINQEGSAQGVPPDVTQRILSVTINES